MAQLDEFLNPKSMVTPGVAGGLTMFVANALWSNFELPAKYTALVISFLFASVVFVANHVPVWQRITLYLLNGLIIFAIAVASNVAGSHKGDELPANEVSILYSPEI